MRRVLTFALTLLLGACWAAAAQVPAKKAPIAKAAQKAASGELLDINSASAEKLMALPGIGEAYSKKIIAGRPYRAKNELVQKNVLPQATYDKIKDTIVARQPGKK
jgi:DNA uptake protein ComE-like DNA-binding protein